MSPTTSKRQKCLRVPNDHTRRGQKACCQSLFLAASHTNTSVISLQELSSLLCVCNHDAMNRTLSREDIQDVALGCTYKKVMVIAVWRMEKKKRERKKKFKSYMANHYVEWECLTVFRKSPNTVSTSEKVRGLETWFSDATSTLSYTEL